jgi:hypothetical protein
MNKSKIVLLTILVISALLIASIPISLNRRLVAGDYAIINQQEKFVDVKLSLQNVQRLFIDGLECIIIPDDSTGLEIAELNMRELVPRVSGDTLIMQNKSNTKAKVRLFASHVKEIVAHNSTLVFKGSLYPHSAASHEIFLHNSTAKTLPISKETRVLQFFNTIKIRGVGDARVSLSGSVHIDHLFLQDIDSAFSDNMVILRSFETSFSGKSKISSLSTDGKFLIKAED